MPPTPDPEPLTVTIERVVAGAVGLGHEDTGRVVLVSGGLAGEEIRVTPARVRRDVVHAEIDEVLTASPDRVTPPCAALAAGCGGCDLQHVAPDAQAELKVGMVEDALRHLGGVEKPLVRVGPRVPGTAYRTTVRAMVVEGRAALRARASHHPVRVDHCLVAHPGLDEVLAVGVFGGAREVTVRVGARTGDRMVIVAPEVGAVEVPADVVVVGADALSRGAKASFAEVVDGRRWRVSARSFFQPSAEGAEALVAVATELAGEVLGAGPLADLYGGIGLFAGTLGTRGRVVDPAMTITLVERSRSAAGDARANLNDLGAGVRVREMAVERWRPEPAALVVADPSREGLGKSGVSAVAGTGARRLVLVSCDAAALGRDARLLDAAGFRLVDAVVVDQFAMTSHVEVVSRFDRA